MSDLATRLMDADTALTASMLVARQRVVDEASTLAAARDRTYVAANSEVGRTSVALDGQAAILFMHLVGWLSEPSDTTARDALLRQLTVVSDTIKASQVALTTALTLVKNPGATPSAVLTTYQLPDDLVVRQEATLTVSVVNPSSVVANGVVASIEAAGSAGVASSPSASGPADLGSLAAGGVKQSSLAFVPSEESGLFTVQTKLSSGGDSFRLIPFSARKLVAGTPTPSAGSAAEASVDPFGVWHMFGLLAATAWPYRRPSS